MSVPKKKSATRRKKLRRSHHALTAVKLASCPKCKQPIKPHHACSECGFYKGKDVLNIVGKAEAKAKKKLEKDKEKELKQE